MDVKYKKIAALTMLRHDDFFLRRWVDYYGACIGRSNLYVFFDGEDQEIPDFCAGVNAVLVPRIAGNVREGDRGRIAFLNDRAAELFKSYDAVIGTDVDEFLVPDPSCGLSLAEFISSYDSKGRVSISGLGIDVGQNLREEAPVDESLPFIGQRRFAKISTRYSKASVLLKPARWGSGFHRVKGRNFHIAKNLYLFHFGCVDLGRIREKFSDREKINEGWQHHLDKRAATIRLASNATPGEWDETVKRARMAQNAVRPPYAWNKPAMFELSVLVRIPERFVGIV